MKTNWFAINRAIVTNKLFVKKPLWGWAWVNILTHTNYNTQQVCLTEVYRDLSEHFTYPQWRHMIGTFVKEGMLEITNTVNLGDKAGHKQTATVCNWSKYQFSAQSEQPSEHSANDGANTERSSVPQKENTSAAQSEHSANDSASTQRVAESNKNTFQEVNLLTPPTPPSAEYEPNRTGENYDANLLQSQYDEAFRRLAKIKSISGANTEQFKVWSSRVLADCRALDGLRVAAVLSDMAVNYPSLNFPWKWYAKQISALTVTGQPVTNVAPRSPALQAGDAARTPDGHTRTVADVCSNGMVVFEDDSPPVHLNQLQPLYVAAV